MEIGGRRRWVQEAMEDSIQCQEIGAPFRCFQERLDWYLGFHTWSYPAFVVLLFQIKEGCRSMLINSDDNVMVMMLQ